MLKEDLFSTFKTIEIRGEKLFLLPEKAIYWEAKGLLIIADLHLGKSAHFRKNGIAVPTKVEDRNWYLLHHLFQKIQPKRVHFLGDLFHSTHNKEWDVFRHLIQQYYAIQFELTIGNHDILNPELYRELKFKLFNSLVENPFIFTHEPLETANKFYNLAGHIHPGVQLKGKGNQKHRLACFYFGKNGGLLPAFGSFTGLATIKVKKTDQIFVVAKNKVIAV
ncbi:MAG: DNA ligase-associated metallophosphoesterase [Vicingaceae bacterium]|jgi:DNA ligase-associated metallophosphoesterase